VFALSRGGLEGWNERFVIAGFVAAVVLLPLFLLVERHERVPLLDLSIFRSRLFSAASAAAFLNGLARFALLFLFVIYFQGPRGYSPLAAGIRVAPMAVATLFAAPIAGRLSDRRGSRELAALGMILTAAGLALMTTIGAHTPYWKSALWLAIVGAGSGVFNSPNTAEMMAAVPARRRGIAAGARTMLQNTGAVISISLMLAIVSTGIPKPVLFKIFSGVTSGLPASDVSAFITNMHEALWALTAVSILGTVATFLQPRSKRSTPSTGSQHP
jgi:MFS family permease